jgi:hypothetical protein
MTPENVLTALRKGPLRLTSPSASLVDLASAVYWIFLAHPFRRRQLQAAGAKMTNTRAHVALESKSQT